MARFAQSGGEDEFPEWCVSKSEREFSLASTMLPSSPLLSRMVSPEHDHETAEHMEWDGFELTGFPDEITKSSHFEEVIKEIRGGRAKYPSGGLADEISKSYELLQKVAGTADEVSKVVSGGCIPEEKAMSGTETQSKVPLLLAFALGVIVRYLYLMSICNILFALMGLVAALMLLPGIYLYVVDGCRPEDYEENVNNKKCGSPDVFKSCDFEVSMNEVRSGRATYAVGTLADEVSKSSRRMQTLLSKVEVSTIIPDTYCAEGCEEHVKDRQVVPILCLLAFFGLGFIIRYLFVASIACMFFALMGTLAALMILPGIYLYAVDGCRPDDYEETTINKEDETLDAHQDETGNSSKFDESMKDVRSARANYPIGGFEDEICKSYGRLRNAVDTHGCGAGYHEGSSNDAQCAVAVRLLIAFGLGVIFRHLYVLSLAKVFFVLIGSVTALMILPGIYLYAVDGCRPEDYDDNNSKKSESPGDLPDEICKAVDFEESMVEIRSGLVPYPIGGLADEISKSYMRLQMSGFLSTWVGPQDSERRANDKQGTPPLRPLSAFGLGVLVHCLMPTPVVFLTLPGFMAVLMLLLGFYLYAVGSCGSDDYEENFGSKKNGTHLFWLMALILGAVYGMCISGTFRALMGTVAALMLLPGMYLYLADECRPEDHEDELGLKSN